MSGGEREKLTFWQRLGVREIRRAAGKKPGEPLTADDWAAAYEAEKGLLPRTVHALWSLVGHSRGNATPTPSSPATRSP